MPNTTITSTTQQFLDIFDITNNFVIMKDGTTSLIIAVDAMNFGLLAEEEQDSVMYAYAGLLNSLNYTVQILIRSQTKDVTGYLHLLKDQEDASPDRSKQKRIQKYREFVSNLIRERNVLDKKFFVIIPAQPVELGILPPSSILPGKGEIKITSVDRNLIIEKAKNILEPKKDHLIAQFARIGLYSRQLDTQEVIQLFYLSYNPEAQEGQHIGDSSSYTPPLVSAKIEGSLMNDSQIQSFSQNSAEEKPIAPVRPAPDPAAAPASAPAPAQAAAQPAEANPNASPYSPSSNPTPIPAEPDPSIITKPEENNAAAPAQSRLSSSPQQPPNPSGLESGKEVPVEKYSPTQMSAQMNAQNNIPKSSPIPGIPTIPKKGSGEEEKTVPQETGAPIKKPEAGLKNIGVSAQNPINTPNNPGQAVPSSSPVAPESAIPANNSQDNGGKMPPLPEI